MSPNLAAFLGTIKVSELGSDLIAVSDNGFNVIVGSTASAPVLFTSYADHPRRLVWLPKLNKYSSAAGAYQILARYFDVYRVSLHLPDFSPASQGLIAVQMLREVDALDDIEAGRFAIAINKASAHWASLPGSPYGQHVNLLADLRSTYVNAGGTTEDA